MKRIALAAVAQRTIAYATGGLVIALLLAALMPLPSAEFFTTVAYVASIVAALAMAVAMRMPHAFEPRRPTLSGALRVAPLLLVSVVVVALLGDALFGQPRGQILGAVAYAAAIGAAIALAVACVSRART